MKQYAYTLMAMLAITMAVTSCRDLETSLVDPNMKENAYKTNTYAEQFKRVWQGIDVGYTFWKWDNVDWDSVYQTDLPIFEEADRHVAEGSDALSGDEYTEIWRSIIVPLADHHMTVFLRDPYTNEGITISPRSKRRSSPDYHEQFSMEEHLSTIRNMIASGELNASLKVDSTIDDQNSLQYIISGMINDHIAYLYMSSYMISLNDSAVNEHLDSLYANVRYETNAGTFKGFILDTRNNGGGYASWQDIIGSWFTQKDVTVSYQYMKKDIGRYDYASPTAITIHPDTALFLHEMSDECPILCLFDQNSVSNSEEIPWMLSKMPGYASVGERTGGGMGGLMQNTYTPFFSGSFGNENIVTEPRKGNYYCYMSLYAHVDAQTGQCPEGIGMIPQIEEPLDTAAFYHGIRDNQLLRAIRRVETGK